MLLPMTAAPDHCNHVFILLLARYQTHWKHMLVMRKTSQHCQCRICFDLNLVLRNPQACWETKVQAAQQLREHHRHQYMDRTLYWSLRWASSYWRSVLVIMIDGMGKWGTAWPSFGHDRPSKDLESLPRPKLCITGVLAHGWATLLYAAASEEHHGAVPLTS